MGGECVGVFGLVAEGEQGAVDERVEGLDPPVHDLREAGDLGDVGDVEAGVA